MADFGQKLREARERRGISLREIANTTKISVAALESLERDDPSKLPGGIFMRAFVRSYASEVGLDPDATVRELVRRFDLEPPATAADHMPVPAESDRMDGRGQRVAGLLMTVLVVSLAIAALILYLALGRHGANQSTAPQPAGDRSATTGRTIVEVAVSGSVRPEPPNSRIPNSRAPELRAPEPQAPEP